MSCSKRFTTFRVRLLNSHISVPESDDLFFTFVTCFYNKLLASRNLTLGLVAFHLGLVDLRHHKLPTS